MTKNQNHDALKEKAAEFPTGPGVYLMKSQGEKIIYVGKAKNLRSRVKSYFSESKDQTPKTRFLVSHIHSLEYIITKTEVEAFLLEASLIKKHRPKYNIRLKDDKTYPYIRLTMQDDFPRLYLSRKVKKDGAMYFGPYMSGQIVSGTIKFLNTTFHVRDCKDQVMKGRSRPCMTYQIGRCRAPCVGLVSKEEYGKEILSALHFLRGKNRKVISELMARMKEAANEEKFELAAKLRDSVNAIEALMEKQSVVDTREKDIDAIGYFGNESGTVIETLHVRQGRVLGTRAHFIPLLNPDSKEEDPRDWLTEFINQYYDDNVIPEEVLLPLDIGGDLTKLLGAVLEQRAEMKVRVTFPTDEKGHSLVEMANKNSQSHHEAYVKKSENKLKGLEVIAQKLHLAELPLRIECFDISNFQGAETVASQVVFEEGVPSKDNYRRYKIRLVGGPDDYLAMKEVLQRRFKHQEWDDPDLIVIDGGKGQLSAALQILKEIQKDKIPIVGLAKARTESDFTATEVKSTSERFFLPGRQNPVIFPSGEALHILVGIRDEAHRFAISYHRKLREATSLASELDYVVGLGEKRKKILLTKFNSIDDIKSLSGEELAALPGFNRVLAERILIQLGELDEEIEVEQ